jgi:hypothetical protein
LSRAIGSTSSQEGRADAHREESHARSNTARPVELRAAFRADLDIGSGVVEGAVRNLVAVRLDGPRMSWGRDRAERVLHLRCVLLNGLWDDFAHQVASRELKLPEHPATLSTMQNLAGTLYAQGDLPGARKLEEAALEARTLRRRPD